MSWLALLGLACLASTVPWPMNLPVRVTSTFGEYRAGHFHGGIDFSTYGTSGVPIVALAPCYVSAVRVDHRGYGKTLTVVHDDGYTVRYAHLKKFSPRIESHVRLMQEVLGRCVADFGFEEHQVRFSPGDTVAFSGSSGVGPPHLHMEVYDPRGNVVNPLVEWYQVQDTIPPTALRLALRPLSVDALVDGRNGVTLLPLRRVGASEVLEPPRSPSLCGDIGVAVKAMDRVSHGSDRVGLYRLVSLVDGEEVFRREYRFLKPDETKLVQFVYDGALLAKGVGRFERCYRFPGDDMSIHEGSPGDGILRAGVGGLAYGSHLLELVLEDVGGNSTRVRVPFTVNRPPEVMKLSWQADTVSVELRDEHPGSCQLSFSVKAGGKWYPRSASRVGQFRWVIQRPPPGVLMRVQATDEQGVQSRPYFWGVPLAREGQVALAASVDVDDDYARIRVVADRDLAGPPYAFVSAGKLGYTPATMWAEHERAWGMELVFFPEASPGFRVVIMADAVSGGTGEVRLFIPLRALAVGNPSVVMSEDGFAWLEAEPGVVYRNTYLKVEALPVPQPSAWLQPVGLSYRFTPEAALLRRPVTITMRLPEGTSTSGVAIFRREGTRYLPLESTRDEAAGLISAPTYSLGTFVLLADTLPPSIWAEIPEGATVDRARTRRVSAYISDRGSGLDASSVAMVLDGQLVPACPEGGAWVHRREEPLAPGDHLLQIRARDQTGNESSVSVRFSVR